MISSRFGSIQVTIRIRDAGGRWRILEAAARPLPEDSDPGAILISSGPFPGCSRGRKTDRGVLERLKEQLTAGSSLAGQTMSWPGWHGRPRPVAGEEHRVECIREALPLERALAELREGAGSQFDPRVVEAMLTMAGD